MRFIRVALPSLTICSTPLRSVIAKLAANEESVSLIPIPTSAYLMAIRSLAPSPHIPTLNVEFIVLYISLNLLTINALDSGDILAKSLIVFGKVGSGFIFRKSLSIAMVVVWLKYSLKVRKTS